MAVEIINPNKRKYDKYIIKPTGDFILVERIDKSESDGGVILPENMHQEIPEGRVIAVGQGHYTINGVLLPLEVQVGQRVLYSDRGATEVEVGSKKYYLMTENYVMAILKPRKS